jgi:hypothetical protein
VGRDEQKLFPADKDTKKSVNNKKTREKTLLIHFSSICCDDVKSIFMLYGMGGL